MCPRLPCSVVLQEGTGVPTECQGVQGCGPQQGQLSQSLDAIFRQDQVLDLWRLWQVPDRAQVVPVQV